MLRRLPAFTLLLLLVCLHVFALYANDVWMHLLLGRDTLSGGIPDQETYSYTAAGQPFVYHEWLSGVLLYGLHRLGGVSALLLLQPLAALAVAWFLLRTARLMEADPDIAVLAAGFGIYVASFRFFVRPHLLALPLLAATLWLLELYRRRGSTGPLAALLVLQALWANLHGSFPEGIALALLFAAGEWARRAGRIGPHSPAPLWGFLALPPALVLASLANPYGWDLVRLAVLHPVDPMFRARIYEYFPTFGEAFRGTRMFGLYLGWLAILGIATWLGRRRLDPAHLVPIAAFGVLSAWMNRAVADFVLVSIPWVALGVSSALPARARSPRWKPLGVAAILLLLTTVTAAYGYRFDRSSVRRLGWGVDPFTPVSSADYLERNRIRGNVFCSFPHGSYLAYRLSPAIRVVFDSRTIPYGPEIYGEFAAARASVEAFRRHLERYPVDVVHLAFRLDGSPGVHSFLQGSPGWDLVHVDDQVVIYLRRGPPNEALTDPEPFLCLQPVLFDHRGIPPDEAACWEADARRLLSRDPAVTLPRFLLAAALRVQGRSRDALAETDRILESGEAPAFVHRLRAVLFGDLGDPARARAEEEAAARLEG